MAERKAASLTIAIEPTLLRIARDSDENLSFLVRKLLMAYLLEKGYIDRDTIARILV